MVRSLACITWFNGCISQQRDAQVNSESGAQIGGAEASVASAEAEVCPPLSTQRWPVIFVYYSILGDIRLWFGPRLEHLLSS